MTDLDKEAIALSTLLIINHIKDYQYSDKKILTKQDNLLDKKIF